MGVKDVTRGEMSVGGGGERRFWRMRGRMTSSLNDGEGGESMMLVGEKMFFIFTFRYL